jgi:hypothetical protein
LNEEKMMKLIKLLPLLVLVFTGCADDSATKQESVQIFAAATAAMSSAQSKAVEAAKSGNLVDPEEVELDYMGACALGGGVTVKGRYAGDGSDDHATFDLETTFASCHEATGTLDGNLHWESDASSDGFSASITGELDWTSNNGSASCDFDLSLSVTSTTVNYSGHLCGYDVGTLTITGN